MAELTIEQQRALTLARARARAAASAGGSPAAPTLSAPEAPKPFERAGGYGPVAGGVAEAGIKGYMGIKQLFGGLSAEDKAILREVQAESEADPEGGWRTTGEIGANIAALAVPGSKLEKVIQAGKVGLARGAAAVAGSAAAQEAVTSVGEGDTFAEQLASKGKNAAKAAAVGGVLKGTMSAIAKPFQATHEAEVLFRQGVNPTLQQGADSAVGRFVGGLASGTTKVRTRQEEEIARRVGQLATEGQGSFAGSTGAEILEHADDYIKGEYDKVLKPKRFPLTAEALGGAAREAQKINSRGQLERQAREAGAAVANVIGPADLNSVNRKVGSNVLYDNYLNKLSAAASAEKDPETAARILAARQYLVDTVRNKGLSADELARLKEVDVRNFDLERIREATAGATKNQEGIPLKKLSTAYASRQMPGNTTEADLIAPAQRVLGPQMDQQMARSGLITAARIMGGPTAAVGAGLLGFPGVGQAIGGAYALSALGQTRRGAKALFGQYEAQKKLAEALRNGITSPAAAGMTNLEYQDVPQ